MRLNRLTAMALAIPASLTAYSQGNAPAAPDVPPSVVATVDNSLLDAPLFYQLLIGEIELNRGDAGTGYQVLLDAARKTRDERLFKRATDVALEAQAGDQALDAARAWRAAVPTSIDAARYEVQLLIALNRTSETVAPLRAILASVAVDQRPAAINSLPGYFSRTADRKATAAVLEQVLQPYIEARAASASPDGKASAIAAWVALGRGRLGAGNGPNALEAARKAQALDAQAEPPALLGIELMATEPRAEELVTNYLAAKTSPSNTTRSAVRLAYARTLAVAQRYADAEPQIEAVTRESPQFTDAWLTLGALRLELKKPTEAEQALTEYLKRIEATTEAPAADTEGTRDDEAITPSQRLAQAYLLLAQSAEQRRDFKAAEEWLSKVDSSQALSVQTRRASMLAQQGRLDEARALIRKLPERTPDDARAKLLAEIQLLRDQKQWQPALTLLSEANQRYTDDTDLLYEQAMVAERLNRVDDMEQILRRVIALKPLQPAAYNALGYSLADRNLRLPEARQLIARAVELAPGDPFLVDSLGWVEYRLGNHEEALKWLRQAHRSRPDTEIAAHLGEVLWVAGKRDEARRILAEARARDAGNDVLKETLARLKVDL